MTEMYNSAINESLFHPKHVMCNLPGFPVQYSIQRVIRLELLYRKHGCPHSNIIIPAGHARWRLDHIYNIPRKPIVGWYPGNASPSALLHPSHTYPVTRRPLPQRSLLLTTFSSNMASSVPSQCFRMVLFLWVQQHYIGIF